MTLVFPFSALVGQEDLREALLACAVDPAIGGVLVRGERGTAKTTAVRGLAPLISGRLVELPIGATADRVLGTLDLDLALREGKPVFQPGLLAAAHEGLLYVDEVNLLPDHLVDVLLDAAALGRVHVERDGLSEAYDARFLLVGTMNPEEGDLRPQLLDRFGLSVEVTGSADPAVRVEIVRRRLAFDRDPAGFAARFADEDHDLAARVAAARERAVRLPDRMLLLIAGACARLGVDGHRADIVTARTAVALAALDGADEVDAEHVRRAARLALAHRRRRGPLQQPGLDDTELDAALEPPDEDPEPPASGPNGHPPERTNGRARPASECARSGAPRGDAPGDEDVRRDDDERGDGDQRDDRTGRGPCDGDRPYRAGAPACERLDAPEHATAPILTLPGRGTGTAGRRSRTSTGEPIDTRPAADRVTDLALAATLRAALGQPPRRHDLREYVRAGKEGNLVVFCVDASGSMGARKRMAQVKGVVLGLLTDAYQRRDRVALVTFRDDEAQVVLPPTSSVERAARAIESLPTGGRTPLARGLEQAELVIRTERRRDPSRRALAVIVTDGRSQDHAHALHAAASLARAAHRVVVLDGEQGPVRLGLARELAKAAGGEVLALEAA